MKVLIFGATGMVGQGVLLECLRDPTVEQVVTVGRNAAIEQFANLFAKLGLPGTKRREIVHSNLADLSSIERDLIGFDACFFPLGVSSSGMSEADYDRITNGLTIAVAETLSRLNPGMTFIYVSGAGTDSTEQGRVMWARVKGRTENALLRLPLKAYMFRPGIIQPLNGIQSKTASYRIFYTLSKPLLPLLRWAMPNQVLSTREMGQAMLVVAKCGYSKSTLETKDIRAALSAGA